MICGNIRITMITASICLALIKCQTLLKMLHVYYVIFMTAMLPYFNDEETDTDKLDNLS